MDLNPDHVFNIITYFAIMSKMGRLFLMGKIILKRMHAMGTFCIQPQAREVFG